MQNLVIKEAQGKNPNVDSSFANFDYLSFFAGVFVTLLGFGLTLIWEWRKSRQQEVNSLKAIVAELEANIQQTQDNTFLIDNELKIIEQQKIVVKPLVKLNSDFTSFLIVHCPSVFNKHQELLIKMRKIANQTKEINEIIQSRENYRINNGAMTNYESRIKIYDQILQSATTVLMNELPKFVTQLKTYIS